MFTRRNASGQITLLAGDKRYAIAFDRGSVIAARSPMSADSVARVALTNRLATAQHISALQRMMAAAPHSDEVDLLAEIAKLAPAQVTRLRMDTIIRAASRTFAVESGEYIFESDSCLAGQRCEVDIRAIVYHGVRMHLSDDRLAADLRQLGGTHFMLEPNASDELHRFGFCDGEWPMLAALREGASLPELEARHREIDPRTMQAAVYALVASGTARVLAVTRAPTSPNVPRTPTPSSVHFSAPPPAVQRAPTPSSVHFSAPPPAVQRAPTPPNVQRGPTPPNVPRTPTPSSVRFSAPPPAITRAPTPSTVHFSPTPSRTMTPMNISRAGTPMNVARTGTPMSISRTKTNPELAAEAAERATRALKNEQVETAVLELKKAVELVPTDVDYSALLGWALFCAADDKPSAAAETKKALERALHKSDQPQVARFYLGRVERMLGRDREALTHFQAVLELEPDHRDASAEVRVLEARLRQRTN